MSPAPPTPRVTTERLIQMARNVIPNGAARMHDGTTDDYRAAVDSDGWRNKPHRYLYDALGEVDALALDLLDAREQIVKLDAALDAALVVIDQYHMTLFGTPRARGPT